MKLSPAAAHLTMLNFFSGPRNTTPANITFSIIATTTATTRRRGSKAAQISKAPTMAPTSPNDLVTIVNASPISLTRKTRTSKSRGNSKNPIVAAEVSAPVTTKINRMFSVINLLGPF